MKHLLVLSPVTVYLSLLSDKNSAKQKAAHINSTSKKIEAAAKEFAKQGV